MTRIRQVFQNWVGNVIKFMDKPSGEIIINGVRDGDYWQFSVEDNGPEIEEKHYSAFRDQLLARNQILRS